MQICKFTAEKPHERVSSIIKELFLTQRIRSFRVEKPRLANTSIKSQESLMSEPQLNTHSTVKPAAVQTKRKIIQKLKADSINREQQRKAQKQFSRYLVNNLHKTNKLSIERKVPPGLSVLQTMDEGCYEYVQDIQDHENPPKREHPHFCNVILPTQISPQTEKVTTILSPVRAAMGKDQLFTFDDNSVMKMKTVLKFVPTIFKEGSNELETVAEKLGTSTRNVKLLFDLLTDFLKLEKGLRRIGDAKHKSMKKIRKKLKKALNLYHSDPYSAYIPKEESYLSIKEIRELLRGEKLKGQKIDSDSQ